MKASIAFAALALASTALPTTAQAAVFVYAATLSGANENPPNASAGTGYTVLTYDSSAHTLRVQISFSGLTGNTTASHVHAPATPGSNAMVATTTPTFAGFPLGVTAGNYDNILDLTMASSYNAAFVTAQGGTIPGAETALTSAFASGLAYLNVHSTIFGGGEIRGNLAPVPEPASWALMIGGFAFAGAALRRRAARIAFV